jgi:hypothetical protein
LRLVEISQRYGGAFGGEPGSGCRADTARRASDERHSSVESTCHVCRLLVRWWSWL